MNLHGFRLQRDKPPQQLLSFWKEHRAQSALFEALSFGLVTFTFTFLCICCLAYRIFMNPWLGKESHAKTQLVPGVLTTLLFIFCPDDRMVAFCHRVYRRALSSSSFHCNKDKSGLQPYTLHPLYSFHYLCHCNLLIILYPLS